MQGSIWNALSVAAVFGLLDKKSRTDEVGNKVALFLMELRWDYAAATLICFLKQGYFFMTN